MSKVRLIWHWLELSFNPHHFARRPFLQSGKTGGCQEVRSARVPRLTYSSGRRSLLRALWKLPGSWCWTLLEVTSTVISCTFFFPSLLFLPHPCQQSPGVKGDLDAREGENGEGSCRADQKLKWGDGEQGWKVNLSFPSLQALEVFPVGLWLGMSSMPAKGFACFSKQSPFSAPSPYAWRSSLHSMK